MTSVTTAPDSAGDSLNGAGESLVGERLGGRYTIERLIGRGTLGPIYLASQSMPERAVVIKVLGQHWARDDGDLEDFMAHAARLESLEHPNIVSTYDHGYRDGRPFFAFEYVPGELLVDYVALRGRLTLQEFVPIAAQVLKGIGYAHSRELMLRDLNPANIMLCERKGRANFVKLLDLGLALFLRHDRPGTQAYVVGTAGYLAPEAVRGEVLDLRADVYSLGVLFYSMLTGQAPFEGDNATVFYKTVHEQPLGLSEQLPGKHDIPGGLIELIGQCLDKDRFKRPSDANAVIEHLIDVVPAALFRLPLAAPPKRGVGAPTPTEYGNTGLMQLLGGKRGSSPAPAQNLHKPSAVGLRRVATSPDQPIETSPTAAVDTRTAASFRPGVVVFSLLAGALLTIVGGAVMVRALSADDERALAVSSVAPARADARPRAISDATLRQALEQVDALIGVQDFDRAAEVFDRVRSVDTSNASLAVRISRTNDKILVGRLLASGEQLEDKGEKAAATGAYRDALAIDPANAIARSALNRLGDGESLTEKTVQAVRIVSKPTAQLFIDGSPVGATPFNGPISVGVHAIRLSASGYRPWETTLEVTADHPPLSVRLVKLATTRRKRGAGAPSGTDHPTPAPDSIGDPPPSMPVSDPAAAVPQPADRGSAHTGGAKKTGVFLPTPQPEKRSAKAKTSEGSVFLPTHDTP